MSRYSVFVPVRTAALQQAETLLPRQEFTAADTPDCADLMLYPVPSPDPLPDPVRPGQILVGGNLQTEASAQIQIDLLQDECYLDANAALTAEAALGILLEKLPFSMDSAEILVLGWGRIGKRLCELLQRLGASVWVYARNPRDRDVIRSSGMYTILPELFPEELPRFRCIVNTIPAPILSAEHSAVLCPGCFQMELASGSFLPGPAPYIARGLPGRYKPEACGELIAQGILRHMKGAGLL